MWNKRFSGKENCTFFILLFVSMAVVTIDFCLEQMTKQNYKYWTLSDSTGKNEIRSQDDELVSLEESIDELKHVYTSVSGGGYIQLKAYKYNTKERGEGGNKPKMYYIYKILANNPSTSPGNNNTGSLGLNDYLALMQKNNELQRKIEMEELRKALEPKEEKSGGFEKLAEIILTDATLKTATIGFISNAGKGIAGYFTKNANNGAAPHGPFKSGSQQSTNEPISGAFDDSLRRLKNLDPELEKTLQAMASFLEDNPGQLVSIKQILGVK